MKTAAAALVFATIVNTLQVQSAAAPALAANTTSVGAIPRIDVPGPKILARDILGPSAPALDLGPTPPVGSSRIVDRAEIEQAFAAANEPLPKKVPAAVRVWRKTRRLSADEVASAIRTSIDGSPLPRGATLSSVRAVATDVAGNFQRVSVELPPLPRRAGPITVQGKVTFLGDNDVPLQKTVTPLDLVLPPEAAFPEIARGAQIILHVRRGLVEVSIPAVAATDGDIGAILPVTIKPSGRVLRAKAIDKSHAVALEDS